MMAEADQYDEIRKRVEKRYKKRQELIYQVAGYVLTNAMLWFFFHDSWVLWVTFGWGIAIAAQVMDYYNKYGGGAQRKEAEIQREIERERARTLPYEKPKNEPHMRLTDDGELEEVSDGEDYGVEKPKRQL
jgi:hypothetical protein